MNKKIIIQASIFKKKEKIFLKITFTVYINKINIIKQTNNTKLKNI